MSNSREGIGSKPVALFENGALKINATVPERFIVRSHGVWEGYIVNLELTNTGAYPIQVSSITLEVAKDPSDHTSTFRTNWESTFSSQLVMSSVEGGPITVPAHGSRSFPTSTRWMWQRSNEGGRTEARLTATKVSYSLTVVESDLAGFPSVAGPDIAG